MIKYTLSPSLLSRFKILENSILLNIFLPGAGIIVEESLKITSGNWLDMVFQREKKYYKFELKIEPFLYIDLINASITFHKFRLTNVEVKNHNLELDKNNITTIHTLNFYGENEKKICLDFSSDSAGFTITLIK